MKVTGFFDEMYVDYSSYDNLRKVGSVVDGQKNASRKIVYTILEKNIKKEIKVSQLGSKVAEFTEYLHGSIDGVVVNLAQDFSGTNNIPLLDREGNFGTRFSHEASASRYIYTNGSDEFFELFNKDDSKNLIQQYFEGEKIEPMFFVPTLPLLLINGSEGVSSGFAQKILARDPKKIKSYIKASLANPETATKAIRGTFTPSFNGFKGTVKQGEHGAQWLIKGVINRKSINKIEILEVPVGYDLKGYLKVLDKLEDDKVIMSYRDKSEDDVFKFEVTINSKSLKEWNDDELLRRLKLIKKVTENYTVIDETNKIKVFDNPKDIADHFIKIKLDYMNKRKESNMFKLEEMIKYDYSKYKFIELIVNDKLKINKRKKAEIELDLKSYSDLSTKDDSYDYLLNMNISSLTEERMKKLKETIDINNKELADLKLKTPNQLWLDEL